MTERERLTKILDNSPAHFCDGCKEAPSERAESIEKLADYLIASDVVEVRHGSWKEQYANGCWYYDCPFCDDGYAKSVRDENPSNYCSNCGAKMDGERREDNV